MSTTVAVPTMRPLREFNSQNSSNIKELQIPSTAAMNVDKSLKRSHDSFGLDDGDVVDLPRIKKRKTALDVGIFKISRADLKAVRDTAARPIRPLPKRRVLQTAKPSIIPIPAALDVGIFKISRAEFKALQNTLIGARETTTQPSASYPPEPSGHGLSSAISLTTKLHHRSKSSISFPTPHHATVHSAQETIYQDNPEEELDNLLSHSAHSLAISNDGDWSASRNYLGKENLPPLGYVAGARMRLKRVRIPLEELDVTQEECL
ncbi:hypothetical protein MMC07_008709 [Pseudocyphellaria aurata]|nr:hypothetical protein [Pseudocyphellaria aurata]